MIKFLLLALIALPALANPLLETRYVTEIKRDANGNILRRADVLAAFKRIHPCPSTGKTTGACAGWQIDHPVPLKCYGLDAVSNMQWMPIVLKAGAGKYPKDRWELKVYCRPQTLVNMPLTGVLTVN